MSDWREKASEITGSFNTGKTCFIVESDRDQEFYHDGEGILFSEELRIRAYELAYRLNSEGFPSRVRQIYYYVEMAKNPTFENRTINPGM